MFSLRSGIYLVLTRAGSEIRKPLHSGLLQCLIHYLVRHCVDFIRVNKNFVAIVKCAGVAVISHIRIQTKSCAPTLSNPAGS